MPVDENRFPPAIAGQEGVGDHDRGSRSLPPSSALALAHLARWASAILLGATADMCRFGY